MPFSDRVKSNGQGFARVTAESAMVRLGYETCAGQHLALELSPLRVADPEDVAKGHMSPVWGVTEDAAPCLSPFWLSVAQSTNKEQFDTLAEMDGGVGELRVRVSTVDATLNLRFQKSALGIGSLKKASQPLKKTLDVPIISNAAGVEAGTPLYLVL